MPSSPSWPSSTGAGITRRRIRPSPPSCPSPSPFPILRIFRYNPKGDDANEIENPMYKTRESVVEPNEFRLLTEEEEDLENKKIRGRSHADRVQSQLALSPPGNRRVQTTTRRWTTWPGHRAPLRPEVRPSLFCRRRPSTTRHPVEPIRCRHVTVRGYLFPWKASNQGSCLWCCLHVPVSVNRILPLSSSSTSSSST